MNQFKADLEESEIKEISIAECSEVIQDKKEVTLVPKLKIGEASGRAKN